MDDEIEQFLVAKLNVAIEEVEETIEHYHPGKLSQLSSSKLQQLKQLLESRTSAAPNMPKLSRKTLYLLNNLLTEWKMQSKKHNPRSLLSMVMFLYKFASHLERIKREQPREGRSTFIEYSTQSSLGDGGDEVFRWSDGYRFVDETTGLCHIESSSGEEAGAFRRSTVGFVDETMVHGLDDKAMYLQKLLMPQNDDNVGVFFNMIGIVGMSGVGKTMVTQLVFNRPEVKNHFAPRIWVCASRKPKEDPDYRKEMVKRILKSLEEVEGGIIDYAAIETHSLIWLLDTLRQQLAGKRYLVVLDDVWRTNEQYKHFCSSLDQDEEECCEKLAYGLPKGSGGTVVVTSTAKELAMEMVGEDNLHRLQPISDPEICWKIFKDSFGQNDQQLDIPKEMVIESCAGLPLAAKIMGQIAREKLEETRYRRDVFAIPEPLTSESPIIEGE